MKGHTGAMLTMGYGCIIGKSIKQKMNAKSSTEAELIGGDDVMTDLLWTGYFSKDQGYDNYKSIMMRDNKSCMLLEENGLLSSTKRTKHINVRYFFIKDRIENGDVSLSFCPTEEMIADYFTKPLQGKKL